MDEEPPGDRGRGPLLPARGLSGDGPWSGRGWLDMPCSRKDVPSFLALNPGEDRTAGPLCPVPLLRLIFRACAPLLSESFPLYLAFFSDVVV